MRIQSIKISSVIFVFALPISVQGQGSKVVNNSQPHELKRGVPKQSAKVVRKFPKIGFLAGVKPGEDFYWTVEPWTGNDKLFIEARRKVDKRIQLGEKRSAVLSEYKAAAQRQPTSSVAQFLWAYAAFKNRSKLEPGQKPQDIAEGIREALEVPKSPKSYEYARMRWFLHQWDEQFRSGQQHILRPLAYRLLKRNPNDYELKYTLAYDLAYTSNTLSEQETAYRWAREYVKKFPERAAGYNLMGSVLRSRFSRTQKMSVAREAIRNFQRYEAMQAPNSPYKGYGKAQIERVNLYIDIFRRKGKLKAN